jgi:DNA-directed RNA polymerase subunit RPC12/RpoP
MYYYCKDCENIFDEFDFWNDESTDECPNCSSKNIIEDVEVVTCINCEEHLLKDEAYYCEHESSYYCKDCREYAHPYKEDLV